MLYQKIKDKDRIIYFTEQKDIYVTDEEGQAGLNKMLQEKEPDGRKPFKKENIKKDKLKKLIILMTTSCNLRCRYCYLNYGQYAKEEVIHNIDVATAKKAVDLIFEKYPEGIGFVQFFGGEPLIAFKEIKEIYTYINALSEEKQVKPPTYGMVTNGLLLKDEVVDFLNESKMSVSISIDGDETVHDMVRRQPSRQGSFLVIAENMRKYKDDIRFNLCYEMTLNREHVLAYEPHKVEQWLDSIKSLGFERGIVGIVEFSRDQTLDLKEEDVAKLEQMYEEFVDYYFNELEKEQPGIVNLDINKMILSILTKEMKEFACAAGVNQLTLSADGTFYPCPKFADLGFSLGRVEEESIDHTQIKEVIDNDGRESCENCFMRQMCTSYCHSLKYRNKDGRKVIKTRCIHLHYLLMNIVKHIVRAKEQGTLEHIIRNAKGSFTAMKDIVNA